MSLLGGGWQPAQVDALFLKYDTAQTPAAVATPVTTPVISQPASVAPVGAMTQPVPDDSASAVISESATVSDVKPITTSSDPAAQQTKPLDMASPVKIVGEPEVAAPGRPAAIKDQKIAPPVEGQKKSSIWKLVGWTVVTIAVAVAALLGAAYYMGSRGKTTTATTTLTPAPVTAKYSANGLTFDYPGSWKKTNVNELLNATTTLPTGLDSLFFTATNYATVQQAATQVVVSDATKVTSFDTTARSLASLVVGYVTNSSSCPVTSPTTSTCSPASSDTTANAQVTNLLKTTYAVDGTATLNASAAVDTTKVNSVTVSGVTSYWITNGPVAKPYVAVAVPGADGAFVITFPDSTSLTTISSGLQAIYASIKVK